MGITGNLKTMQLSELLQWLALGQKTGILLIEGRGVQKRLFFQNGRINFTITADQVTVHDLSLFGNKTNQSSTSRGVVTPSSAASNYFLLDAVWVDSFNGDGYAFGSLCIAR